MTPTIIETSRSAYGKAANRERTPVGLVDVRMKGQRSLLQTSVAKDRAPSLFLVRTQQDKVVCVP
jgi:hypothetical protein